jgi:palmitoyltransferase ZDHHC9/14/18
MNNKTKTYKRLWEVWPGKNRFFCKGKVMFGPKGDLVYYLPSAVTILIVPMLFFLFVTPYIWTKVTYAIPILSGFFYLMTVGFYFKTMTTDPGIIPRKHILEIMSQSSELFMTDIISIDMNRFCPTCQIYKPNRSHHCRYCDNCVEIFDHHCPYVNNCIGGRNYIYFFLFVINLNLLTLLDTSACFIFLFYDYQALGPAKKTSKW